MPLPAAVDTMPQHKRRRGGGQGAGGLSAAQVAAKQEAHRTRLQQSDMQALNASRARLPIASFRSGCRVAGGSLCHQSCVSQFAAGLQETSQHYCLCWSLGLRPVTCVVLCRVPGLRSAL